LTRVNIRIKVNIIIILKPDLEVNLGQDPIHRSGWLLAMVKIRIKIIIIIVLKLNLEFDQEKNPRPVRSNQVDYVNVNSHYQLYSSHGFYFHIGIYCSILL
jgi:hypothetical protein